jgi:hypothetical protein
MLFIAMKLGLVISDAELHPDPVVSRKHIQQANGYLHSILWFAF